MKFCEYHFPGKHDVRKDLTRSIFIACKESIPEFHMLNKFLVEDYIHLLIDESEYNFKTHSFYINNNVNVPLKVFKNVAIEYILEHINDFVQEKYKMNIPV